MKIGVVGCGAVGSYYGARLCQAGHDTHFLLRSDYEAVRNNGLHIRSFQGDFTVRPHCACAPETIGPCDLVLVALKTTANDQFPRLLPPLVGPHTVILTLQNGLGNEALLARLFPPRQIMGGMCFVCLNRIAPGIVRHLDHGPIVVGSYAGPPEARTHLIARLFQHARVPCTVADNLERAHWEKLTWNIPFNGLGVAGVAGYDAVRRGHVPADAPLGPCLTTDVLLADPRWEKLLRTLMLEVIRAAAGKGWRIDPELVDVQIARTRTMGAYRASTLLDYQRGDPLELESMFLEPLRQARHAGVDTPCLRNLCAVLQALDQRRPKPTDAPDPRTPPQDPPAHPEQPH
ncbi:MAG: 2-dehydropantoate 2-reductase [Verrucomicrobia bacterium]|nr:2-dehydropantoate 2-reductase [Verrucomicrobiota bacterium]